jgi:hypothetical protein
MPKSGQQGKTIMQMGVVVAELEKKQILAKDNGIFLAVRITNGDSATI